jgi:hypothetical protein
MIEIIWTIRMTKVTDSDTELAELRPDLATFGWFNADGAHPSLSRECP